MDVSEIEIWMSVILGRHTDGENWNEDMEQYVGTVAEITGTPFKDMNGKSCVKVNTNGFSWRVENMSPFNSSASSTTTPVCAKCNQPNPYADVSFGQKYICSVCKSWEEAWS